MTRLIAGSTHSHPVSMITHAATTTPNETPGIRRHVQIGAADIEVAVAAAHEQQRGAAVDDDAQSAQLSDDGPAAHTAAAPAAG